MFSQSIIIFVDDFPILLPCFFSLQYISLSRAIINHFIRPFQPYKFEIRKHSDLVMEKSEPHFVNGILDIVNSVSMHTSAFEEFHMIK